MAETLTAGACGQAAAEVTRENTAERFGNAGAAVFATPMLVALMEQAAIDAVALVESGIDKRCAAVVGVTADRETRAARITARDGISREYALMRIDAQPDDAYYAGVCDYMLENCGTETEFEKQCEKIFTEVIENAGKKGK